MNTLLLATALVLGSATGWLLRPPDGPLSWLRLLRAAVVGAAASLVASVIVAIATFNMFAAVHMAYLVCVVAVPLAAAVGLAFAWRRSQWPKAAVRGLLVFAMIVPIVVGIYATHVEPFWLRVDRVALPTDSEHAGLRIAVLSDVQTTEIADYENEALDALIAEEPDLVLIAGDLYQLPAGEIETPDKHMQFSGALKKLGQNIEHVVIVNGNTDRPSVLRSLAVDTGVVVLDNETIDLSIRGRQVLIGGITLFSDFDERTGVVEDLLEADEATFTILLGHQPDEIYMLPPDRTVDLVAAGHTHGGQFSVPFFGPPLTLSDVPRHVAAGGLHTLDDQTIYVSTGVGRERGEAPQMRFGVRPSFGILTTS